MKSLIIAAGIIAAGASAASAQYSTYNKSSHPYAARHHSVCQEKAVRLFGYEKRATSDGRLSRSERATIVALKRDLDRTCGRYRHRG